MSNNNSSKQQSNSIGGLYVKESASGLKFMSGFIEVNGERKNIVVFKNKEKKSEKTPDWSILESKSYDQPAPISSKPTPQRPASKPMKQDIQDDEDIF